MSEELLHLVKKNMILEKQVEELREHVRNVDQHIGDRVVQMLNAQLMNDPQQAIREIGNNLFNWIGRMTCMRYRIRGMPIRTEGGVVYTFVVARGKDASQREQQAIDDTKPAS